MGEPINMRQALAGLNMLKGMTAKEALVGAGFAPSTASNPTQNGLSADRCLQETAKLDPEATPANLLAKFRDGLRQKLDATKWEKESIGAVATLGQFMERSYGAGESLDALGEMEGMRERTAFAKELAKLAHAEAKERELEESKRTFASIISDDSAIIDVTAIESTTSEESR